MDYEKQREVLRQLMQQKCHVVCYIRRDKDLMQAIENYCKGLEVENSRDLNEKAYWFLNRLKEHPHCQYNDCKSKVHFHGLRRGYAVACCTSHAAYVSWPKNRKTNREKYGADTPVQNKEIRKQINQHNLEAYGTINVVESEYFKKKRVETCQKNFGVDWPMQSKEVQEKSKAKCKEIYGVEYVLQNPAVRDKGKQTSREMYGCDYPMQNESFKAKSRETMQKKYGVSAPAQCPEIRRKQQLRCEYNGMNFDSIYEIAYYIWLTDHHIKFEYQPNITFKYEFEGKTHLYLPDFRVDNQIIEIKGDHFFNDDGTMKNPYDLSKSVGTEAKHQCMLANKVKIIRVSEMKGILDYVCKTYGKSYLKQFRRCAKKAKTAKKV